MLYSHQLDLVSGVFPAHGVPVGIDEVVDEVLELGKVVVLSEPAEGLVVVVIVWVDELQSLYPGIHDATSEPCRRSSCIPEASWARERSTRLRS